MIYSVNITFHPMSGNSALWEKLPEKCVPIPDDSKNVVQSTEAQDENVQSSENVLQCNEVQDEDVLGFILKKK